MAYIVAQKGGTLTGVVEGDDGLFRIQGCEVTTTDFARVGLIIKLEFPPRIERARFCSLMFDEREKLVLGDPTKILLNLGWAMGPLRFAKEEVRLGLLRAKAMSLLAMYPRAPILTACARAIVRLTQNVQERFDEGTHATPWNYTQDWGRLALHHYLHVQTVSQMSREIVAEEFDYTPYEQHTIESWFDTLTSIQPIPGSFLKVRQDTTSYFELCSTCYWKCGVANE